MTSLESYLEDASGFRGYAERVLVPRDEAELIGILRDASEKAAPVTIAGAGTGVTGARVALGGWVVSLERFNRLTIEKARATVGAGTLLRDLHAAAAAANQLYPPDPTETAASIGGTIACNASGSRSFRYGDTRRYVDRLRVALMNGTVMDVRRGEAVDFDVPSLPLPRTTKHSAGYSLQPGMDWIDVFVGSEGTLGVVMETDLRLISAPGAVLGGVVFFRSEDDALNAVEVWRGVTSLRMLEYLDGASLDLLRTRIPETPHGAAIIIEDEGSVDPWPDRLELAGADLDGSWFAEAAAERERFRRFRHALPELVNDTVRRNGFNKVGSDYAVPLDRNRDMMAIYRARLAAEFPRKAVVFGHIGDAHVHVNILPSTQEEFARAGDLMLEFAREAVRLGGTVGAEHGLGKRKAHLLALQYTPAEIEAMKSVKRRLDPQWLLGRGTLFPC